MGDNEGCPTHSKVLRGQTWLRLRELQAGKCLSARFSCLIHPPTELNGRERKNGINFENQIPFLFTLG
jgi:hypothetical protein